MNAMLKQYLLAPLQRQWDNLAQREQLIISWGGAILAIGLFYAFVWQPMNTRLIQLHEQVVDNVELITWLDRNAHEVARLRDAVAFADPLSANSFMPVIERTLIDNNLRTRSMNQLSSGQVSVQFESTPFSLLIIWLHELQTHYGLNIVKAEFTDEAEDGIVSAEMILEL